MFGLARPAQPPQREHAVLEDSALALIESGAVQVHRFRPDRYANGDVERGRARAERRNCSESGLHCIPLGGKPMRRNPAGALRFGTQRPPLRIGLAAYNPESTNSRKSAAPT